MDSPLRRRLAHAFAAVVAAGVCWLGIAFGSRAASGADAFGYVSQAYLWLEGDLRLDDRQFADRPWPHVELTLAPLGYQPGPVRRTIVPTYAPGVPLIMAGFHLLFGVCGPYSVAPVFGALLVLGTYWLALRLTLSRTTALVAAALMASSPAFLFNLMWPMSDTITAALWVWVLLVLTRPGVTAAALAGVVAAAAVAARPNLVVLAAAGVLAAVLWPPHGTAAPRRALRGIVFVSAIVPAVVFVAALNNALHGSPFRSGYGPTSALYALSHFTQNVAQYSAALLRSEGVVALFALAALVTAGPRRGWLAPRIAVPAAAFVALVCASYLFYVPYGEWWYLRFFLPAFPLVFVLASAALVWVTGALPPRASAPALVILVVALVGYRWHVADSRGVFVIGRDEHRHVAVGQYIDRALPANAIVFARQHSGSVRYYSGRATIRYDFFPVGRFPWVITALQELGYRPYILLENWEEAEFLARFAERGPLGRLEMRVLAEMTDPVGIRLYDPVPAAPGAPPPDRIVIHSRVCVGPGGAWRR